MEKNIIIYDTTLRDGSQTFGISFSLYDKIKIAQELDKLKIDYIEGGWPGSNPKDDLFFEEIKNHKLKHSKIAAFGSTTRPKTNPENDPFIQALINSQANTLTIVAKSWDFHVTDALKISLEENLQLINDTIIYLKKHNREVFLDAEHFYDAYKANPEYSFKVLEVAKDAGADMLVLCDTNGGTLPHEVYKITKLVVDTFNIPIGVHHHNDAGVAVANGLAAVQAGAISVQGTMNGYGERCGNCDLTTLIPNLTIKMGYKCNAIDSLQHLTESSRYISEIANLAHNERAPYVGDNAFAHKGGIHVSALKNNTATYEHIDPSIVGNRRKVLISELAGKSNIQFKAKELGIKIEDKEIPKKIIQQIKSLEDKGFQFEAAEGSFELLLRKNTGSYKPFFKLKGFRVIVEKYESGYMTCEATIKVEVNGNIKHTAANGNGPVQALDNALRKALEHFYPEIRDLHLSDYKVRVLNEKDGTGSSVRVLIDHKSHEKHWGTVGVSTNIIEASWQALVDGIEFMLLKLKEEKNQQ